MLTTFITLTILTILPTSTTTTTATATATATIKVMLQVHCLRAGSWWLALAQMGRLCNSGGLPLTQHNALREPAVTGRLQQVTPGAVTYSSDREAVAIDLAIVIGMPS
mmetsp:Transcript_50743/g.100941  ORF Transcript_50743/g.100941 Transcript_50743/m.100941 type:complete len:108 (+) Transcript_50743:168-491(+)